MKRIPTQLVATISHKHKTGSSSLVAGMASVFVVDQQFKRRSKRFDLVNAKIILGAAKDAKAIAADFKSVGNPTLLIENERQS